MLSLIASLVCVHILMIDFGMSFSISSQGPVPPTPWGSFALPLLCSMCVDFLCSVASTPRLFSGLPRPSASCALLVSAHAFVAWFPVPRCGLTGSLRLMVLIRGSSVLPATIFSSRRVFLTSGCALCLFLVMTKRQPLIPNMRALYVHYV